MKRKKKQINTRKERVIISDVLPFEVPITFSNRNLYFFLADNGVSLKGATLEWSNKEPFFEVLLKLLFGFKQGKPSANQKMDIVFEDGDLRTIPFIYKISHKENDFRELTIIHPINQLAMIEFYDKYKDMILYYSNISPFSIRKPHKVAKFSYYKDRTHLKNLAHDHEHKSVEEFDKEYENLKTFFSYKDISNIYKFYESYKYHRCEKKYNKLFKFDISKCFDSIYTHTLSWALLNKQIVKDNLGKSKHTFGGKFDQLMQDLNYGETNGIIIGPEFSRIFAEMILQKIDLNVSQYLKKEKGLKFRTDYEIFRYVDDFFVFYNEEITKEEVCKAYKHLLKEYKLYVSDSKSMLFEKPIITELTIAKIKIAGLLNKYLEFKESEKNIQVDGPSDELENEKEYSFYVSSNKLITRFKIIIKETKIQYKDILNYTLACIDRKTLKLIKLHSKIEDKPKEEQKITKAILELLDFTFFLYSVSPRVNSTIKLCLILSKLIKFVKLKNNFNHDNKNLILKKIYDDIYLILWKNKNTKYTQVETLYLLIALKELGREYRLDESVLAEYFKIDVSENKCAFDLNYFSITVLLFYVENKPRYAKLKEFLIKHIQNKFQSINLEKKLKMTELTILLFDLIACPYLSVEFKKELLDCYEVAADDKQDFIVKHRRFWFSKWSDFDFGKELDAKKSLEVY